MIQFRNVTKRYGREYAVENVNLTLEEGKFMVFLVQMEVENQPR